MPSKKRFTDLGFRGTTWYLAEEVDQKLEDIKNCIRSNKHTFVGDTKLMEILEKVEAEA